ncbi:MAG: TonB family protein [Bacteroidetes bacterium]|nr:TonB family protein [Bacteroidota bacterium]
MFSLIGLILLVLNPDPSGGKISGRIVNSETTGSVSSATVFLADDDSPVSSVRTNQSGNFSFSNLEPGQYVLTIRKSGFSDFIRKVKINENFTLRILIPLSPSGINQRTLTESKEKTKATDITSGNPVLGAVDEANLNQVTEIQAETGIVTLEDEKDSVLIVDFPENPPQPVGGLVSIIRNIDYPEIAKRMGIEGKVVVRVTVNEKGEVTQVDILKRANSVLNEAAIYTIYKSRFLPAQHRGKNVISQITLPIQFSLK